MSTTTVEQQLTEIWETPKTLWGQLASVDHKEIGKRYLITAFVLLIIGGMPDLGLTNQQARAKG